MTKTLLERLDEAAATGRGSLGSTIHGDPLAGEAAGEIRDLKQELRNLKDDVAFVKARGPGPGGGWW